MMEQAELCFPLLLNSSCWRPTPLPADNVLLYFVLFVISVLTAALNLLVIIAISHYRQLRSPTNLLLLSLAVSDFLVGFLVMPVEILTMYTCWVLGDLMCALYFFIPVILISASVGSMVLISLDRYVAVCDPLRYSSRITDKIAIVSVSLCWTCSVFYSIFLLYDNLQHPGRYNSCYGECVVIINGDVDLFVAFIIPIAVIIVLYVRVFVVAVSQARATHSNVAAVTELSMSRLIRKSELKAGRTLGVVVVVFLMCYSPYYCLCLTAGDILIGSSTEALMSFVMYFNSCLNPVIYVLFYPWFRSAVKHIVSLRILQPGSCDVNILERDT